MGFFSHQHQSSTEHVYPLPLTVNLHLPAEFPILSCQLTSISSSISTGYGETEEEQFAPAEFLHMCLPCGGPTPPLLDSQGKFKELGHLVTADEESL